MTEITVQTEVQWLVGVSCLRRGNHSPASPSVRVYERERERGGGEWISEGRELTHMR